MNTDQENRENRLYAEKVRALQRQVPSVIFSSFLCAVLYAVIVWEALPHRNILIWLFLQGLVLAGRAYLFWQYKQMPEGIAALRRWKTQFALLCYLGAATWGSVAIFLFPERAPHLQTLLIYLIGGLVAGSAGLHTVFFGMAAGIITLLLSPLIFQYLVLQDDPAAPWIALFSTIYLLLMIATARRVQESVIRVLELAEDLKEEVGERRRAEAELKTAHDVLDLRVRERTLALSEANHHLRKLTNAIEQSSEMVVITDLSGRIEYVNPSVEKTSGYTARELLGQPFQMLRQAAADSESLDDLFQVLRGGASLEREILHKKKSGQFYLADVSMNAVYGDQGEMSHFTLIMRDISDRRKLEQDLLQSSKLSSLGTLTSGIAHELNTPLATILGFSESIGSTPDIPAEINLHASWITQESKRCIGIVRNLLKFSRKYQPKVEIFDVNEAILTVLTLYNYQLKSDSIHVQTSLHETALFVLGDLEQIQQVILNILLNAHTAIESTHKKGIVKVISRRTEKNLSITMENNGPPIPEEHLKKIFDPFFTNKKVGEGTGLGLSVSYGIIEEHRGRIRAENIGTEGVRFLITLPLSEASPEKNDREHDLKADHKALLKGLRILIVEDDDTFRSWLVLFLSQQGAITSPASNGIEAIDHLKQFSTDLILSDLKMPLMGGDELCRWIELHQPDDLKKVIFLSGVSDEDIDDYCIEKKIPFLMKPAPKEELLTTLKRISETVREKK